MAVSCQSLPDRYDEELDENLQQDQQITELEEENEKLKDHQIDGDDGDGGPYGGLRW